MGQRAVVRWVGGGVGGLRRRVEGEKGRGEPRASNVSLFGVVALLVILHGCVASRQHGLGPFPFSYQVPPDSFWSCLSPRARAAHHPPRPQGEERGESRENGENGENGEMEIGENGVNGERTFLFICSVCVCVCARVCVCVWWLVRMKVMNNNHGCEY